MGFNSVLFLCNDAWGQIDRDPKGFWEKCKGVLSSKHPNSRQYYGADEDGTFGFGNHANGFQAVWNEHADVTGVIAVGGNFATVLGSTWGVTSHKDIDSQVKLLKEMANNLGFKLVKKGNAASSK